MEEVISRIIEGSLGIVLGFFMVIKSNWIVNNTGRIATAEKYLGNGGTFTFVRIVGIFLMVVFFAHMTGILGYLYLSVAGFFYSFLGAER